MRSSANPVHANPPNAASAPSTSSSSSSALNSSTWPQNIQQFGNQQRQQLPSHMLTNPQQPLAGPQKQMIGTQQQQQLLQYQQQQQPQHRLQQQMLQQQHLQQSHPNQQSTQPQHVQLQQQKQLPALQKPTQHLQQPQLSHPTQQSMMQLQTPRSMHQPQLSSPLKPVVPQNTPVMNSVSQPSPKPATPIVGATNSVATANRPPVRGSGQIPLENLMPGLEPHLDPVSYKRLSDAAQQLKVGNTSKEEFVTLLRQLVKPHVLSQAVAPFKNQQPDQYKEPESKTQEETKNYTGEIQKTDYSKQANSSTLRTATPVQHGTPTQTYLQQQTNLSRNPPMVQQTQTQNLNQTQTQTQTQIRTQSQQVGITTQVNSQSTVLPSTRPPNYMVSGDADKSLSKYMNAKVQIEQRKNSAITVDRGFETKPSLTSTPGLSVPPQSSQLTPYHAMRVEKEVKAVSILQNNVASETTDQKKVITQSTMISSSKTAISVASAKQSNQKIKSVQEEQIIASNSSKRPIDLDAMDAQPPTKKAKAEGEKESFEELNDVTAVSGINMKEEEEKLLSIPYAHAQDSTVFKKLVRDEEEKFFLEKNNLSSKAHSLAVKKGLTSISEDALKCLSMAAEERIRTILSKLIQLSKQREDLNKMNKKIILTSNIKQKIRMIENREKEKRKEKEVKRQEMILKENEKNRKAAGMDEADKEELKAKAIKAKEMEDDKMRADLANAAAKAAVGQDPRLERWMRMQRSRDEAQLAQSNQAGQPNQTSQTPQLTRTTTPGLAASSSLSGADGRSESFKRGMDSAEPIARFPSVSSPGLTPGSDRGMALAGSPVLTTQPSWKVRRSVTMKDMIALLQTDRHAPKHLLYRLHENRGKET